MGSYEPTEEEKQRFMSRAIELSDEGPSNGHGGPFGAVIVKNGNILGKKNSSAMTGFLLSSGVISRTTLAARV